MSQLREGPPQGSAGARAGEPPAGRFDAVWRGRALAGEPAAVRALADAALQPLYRFCFYRVGRDAHRCEEVVQETLLRAIAELDKYDPARCEGDPLPWLRGLARNAIRALLARERGTTRLEAAWERLDRELLRVYERIESDPFSDEHLQREETRELVNATMSQLPSGYRDVLEAKYVLGQSVRTIAEAFRTSEKAVESRLSRARRAFRGTFLALTRNLNLEAVNP